MHLDHLINLATFVLAQTSPVVDAPPSGMVQFLQEYGGWGVAVVLGGTVGMLGRAYKTARDNETATLKEQSKELIALTVETNKTNLELKNALLTVASAMQSMDRRLEDVERNLEKD